jgi:hypothetical protein
MLQGTDGEWTRSDAVTEAEWLTCTDPAPMLRFLRGKASDRKRRLFACACCRRVWGLLAEERTHRVVAIAERFADGRAESRELRAERNSLSPELRKGMAGGPAIARSLAASVVYHAATQIDFSPSEVSCRTTEATAAGVNAAESTPRRSVGEAVAEDKRGQAASLRCIFGNPFRRVAVDPSWLTSTAVTLARTIYEDRAFDRLPILADALEDASCDNADLLPHCRGDGPHTRGCWVVDLVLGNS